MTSPLIPIGGVALGTLALSALRELHPGQFLHELWKGRNEAGSEGSTEADASKADADSGVTEQVDPSRALHSLVNQLRTRLVAAGVDVTQPIILKDDGRGGVIVDGDHPDRVAIEELFAADALLRSEFQSVARAATEDKDELAPWLGPSWGEFRLHLDEDEAEIRFE